jgi:hypothetical protein
VKERQEFDREGNACGVTREIKIYDRSGKEFDGVCDRTDGKPTQAVSLDGNLGIPTVVEFITPGTRARGLAQQGATK